MTHRAQQRKSKKLHCRLGSKYKMKLQNHIKEEIKAVADTWRLLESTKLLLVMKKKKTQLQKKMLVIL